MKKDETSHGEGIAVVIINGVYYCSLCGMKIVNEPEWKHIHLNYHKS